MLNKEITNILEEVYVKKNSELYLEKCKQEFKIDSNSIAIIANHKYAYTQSKTSFWPSSDFYLKLGTFKKDSFQVEYRADLVFSKLAKAYSLEFIYEIENHDPDAYSPDFSEMSDEPLTIKQANFLDEFQANLKKLGFIRVTSKEKNLVVTGLKYKSPNDLYNGQVDLWTALTYDVLDQIPE